jgi:hypothetical protein
LVFSENLSKIWVKSWIATKSVMFFRQTLHG